MLLKLNFKITVKVFKNVITFFLITFYGRQKVVQSRHPGVNVIKIKIVIIPHQWCDWPNLIVTKSLLEDP